LPKTEIKKVEQIPKPHLLSEVKHVEKKEIVKPNVPKPIKRENSFKMKEANY
jgi:hypothetical protein